MAAKKKARRKAAAKKAPSQMSQSGPCGAVNDKNGCKPNGPCPDTLDELCEQMRNYMRCMCEWGVDVVAKIEALKLRVDKCCGGPGPNGVPKPPPPPF